MYSREYGGRELHFEASGGLKNASLVMQDRETDSYWSIMSGEAEAGTLTGTELVELPVSEKVRWAEWRQRHPDTLVLSVGGQQHSRDGYEDYWESPRGYRGIVAADERLATKAPIYAFEIGGTKYAVPHAVIAGGATFTLVDGSHVFLHRAAGSELFDSTAAYRSTAGFEARDGGWVEVGTAAAFDAESGRFDASVTRLSGFDTFWYNWSLNNPDTELLDPSE